MALRREHLAPLVAVATCLTVPAQAAGPTEAAPEPAVSALGEPTTYDWTGPYVGAFASYSDGDAKWLYPYSLNGQAATGLTGVSVEPDFSGYSGGALIGYNHQFRHFVLGIEGDIAVADIDGATSCPNEAWSCEVDIDWMTSVRGRLGVPWKRALVYATGGAIAAGARQKLVRVNSPTDTRPLGFTVQSDRQAQLGWTIGGGLELAVRDNVTLRAEGLYFDLGSHDYTTIGDTFTESVRLHPTGYQVRAAIVFRFP